MRIDAVALRTLLVLLALGVLLAYAVLFVVSGDLATTYPSLAHLRVPLFSAAAVASVPVVVALVALWRFTSLAARGEGFSARAVVLLRLQRTCFGALAVYLLAAFLGASVALAPEQSPAVLVVWCASEVLAVFLFTFASVMVRLFDDATAMRHENELTV